MRGGDEDWGLRAGRCSCGGCGIREDGCTAGGVTRDITRLPQPHHIWILVTSECACRGILGWIGMEAMPGVPNEEKHKRLRAEQGRELYLGLKYSSVVAGAQRGFGGTSWVSPAPCSLPPRPTLSIHQALTPRLVFFLILLTFQPKLQRHDQANMNTAKQIEEFEEYLRYEMIWLLQVIEGKSGTMEAPLLSAVQQQWLF